MKSIFIISHNHSGIVINHQPQSSYREATTILSTINHRHPTTTTINNHPLPPWSITIHPCSQPPPLHDPHLPQSYPTTTINRNHPTINHKAIHPLSLGPSAIQSQSLSFLKPLLSPCLPTRHSSLYTHSFLLPFLLPPCPNVLPSLPTGF